MNSSRVWLKKVTRVFMQRYTNCILLQIRLGLSEYSFRIRFYISINQWFSFQEWVDVKVLEVNEAGRTLITSEHLRVIVDYGFYGIPESGVLFHMASPPTRGRLDVTVWNSQDDNIFTLLDLNTDQVSCKMYFHVHECFDI